jgi:Ni2+-binding GTPase involved in maturation of urease and hydrogenase
MATESVTARSLLITGTVGAGKTSVLLEIGELLALADDSYAIVDLDWLPGFDRRAGRLSA